MNFHPPQPLNPIRVKPLPRSSVVFVSNLRLETAFAGVARAIHPSIPCTKGSKRKLSGSNSCLLLLTRSANTWSLPSSLAPFHLNSSAHSTHHDCPWSYCTVASPTHVLPWQVSGGRRRLQEVESRVNPHALVGHFSNCA